MILMFITVISWFIMCRKLFSILKSEHPDKYNEMGNPGLFINNNLKSNYKLLKYLVKKEWEPLNNEKLSKVSNFMRIFFTAFISLFLIIQAVILLKTT